MREEIEIWSTFPDEIWLKSDPFLFVFLKTKLSRMIRFDLFDVCFIRIRRRWKIRNLKGHFSLLNRKLICYHQKLSNCMKSVFVWTNFNDSRRILKNIFHKTINEIDWFEAILKEGMNQSDYRKDESTTSLTSMIDSTSIHRRNINSIPWTLSILGYRCGKKYPNLSEFEL